MISSSVRARPAAAAASAAARRSATPASCLALRCARFEDFFDTPAGRIASLNTPDLSGENRARTRTRFDFRSAGFTTKWW